TFSRFFFPKIPQQRQPLPSNILQQNLSLLLKLPPLFPKAKSISTS
ncbi:14852_t:CDS:1, partial [Funneliformis caledonium]